MYLDPEIEFDAVLIEMKKMHDLKSQGYGSNDEPLQNFYDVGRQMGITPFEASEVLLAKHQSAIKQWLAKRDPIDGLVKTSTSDDALIDRAVYAVISRVLYGRVNT
jgi:hypothetical protein